MIGFPYDLRGEMIGFPYDLRGEMIGFPLLSHLMLFLNMELDQFNWWRCNAPNSRHQTQIPNSDTKLRHQTQTPNSRHQTQTPDSDTKLRHQTQTPNSKPNSDTKLRTKLRHQTQNQTQNQTQTPNSDTKLRHQTQICKLFLRSSYIHIHSNAMYIHVCISIYFQLNDCDLRLVFLYLAEEGIWTECFTEFSA